jgi:hypothetical protein
MFGPDSATIYSFGLAVALVVAYITVAVTLDWRVFRVITAIAINWCLGSAFTYFTEITDGWWFNILIDGLAAWVILYSPSGKCQSALGVSYCIQIAMHVGYGARVLLIGDADRWQYYNALTFIAWLQLLLVGGWCIVLWDRHRRRRDTHPRVAQPVASCLEAPK